MEQDDTPVGNEPEAPFLPSPSLPGGAAPAPSLPTPERSSTPPTPSIFDAGPTTDPVDAGDIPTLAPTLPPATPTPPAPPPATDAPFLPASTPAAPPSAPAAEPAAFDAKAMVASQKHYTPEPTYGAMPSGTEEGREAARKLREQANRKKRRGKVVGRVVGLVILAGLGVGGFFGYQAYQDGQDDDAATDDDGSGDASGDEATGGPAPGAPAAGLTPLGVIDEQLRTQDAVNSGTRTGVGGYLDAIDDARALVDDINEDTADITDITDTSIVVDPSAPENQATRLDVVVTRFDLSTPDVTVVQQFVADLTNDTYLAVTGTGGEVLAVAETDADSHYQYDAGAGTLVSASRGRASLRPGPDGLFVAPLTPATIHPPAMVLHSTSTPIPITASDGTELLSAGYVVDLTGFTSTQPDAAAAWRALVQEADPGRQPSIEAGTVATVDRVPADDLAIITSEASDDMAFPDEVDLSAAPTPTADQAVIGWSVADNGLITHLYVHLGDGTAHWLYEVDDFEAPPFGPLLADVEPLG